MKRTIDLNSDLGEGAGHDEEILSLVSSANIACGLHAASPVSIFATICGARDRGVAVGAHPSLDDRENFGRLEQAVAPPQVFQLVIYQLGALKALCAIAGTRMHHVKAHGALYNMAARDPALAKAIVQAVKAIDPGLLLLVPPGSAMEVAARDAGLASVAEIFADRNYLADGSLVPRTRPDALLHDPEEAAERIVRWLRTGKLRPVDGDDIALSAETICVHGDSPAAVDFVRLLRRRLEAEGVMVAAPNTS